MPVAREPDRPPPQPQPSAQAVACAERQRRQAVSTVLVGTVRVRTNRRGQTQREITDLSAVRYRYELSINEVFASATGVAYENYRFPITMPDAVLARCGDLLVDGQRVAVLGPITFDVTYNSRFQTDAYDAGLRTWTMQMDVLDVRVVGDDVPDMAWVQLEGEVIDRPRIFAHRYGDHYAGIILRCRELLAGPRGAAARVVTRVVPIEVLIDPHEELIAVSDALLRPGNLVRIEGCCSPSIYQIRPPYRQERDETNHEQRPDKIAQALERARTASMMRNAELRDQAERHQQAVQTVQEHNRARIRARRLSAPRCIVGHSRNIEPYQLQGSMLGVPVHFVDPRNTSRTCPACGYCAKENRKTQTSFVCVSCGFAGLADTIAAENMRVLGRAAVNLTYCSDSNDLLPAPEQSRL